VQSPPTGDDNSDDKTGVGCIEFASLTALKISEMAKGDNAIFASSLKFSRPKYSSLKVHVDNQMIKENRDIHIDGDAIEKRQIASRNQTRALYTCGA
jgi:hypothetical protein